MTPSILWLPTSNTTVIDNYKRHSIDSVEIPKALMDRFSCPKYVTLTTETAEFDEGTLFMTTSGFANSCTGEQKGVPSGVFLPEFLFTDDTKGQGKKVRIGGYMLDDVAFMVPRAIKEWGAPRSEEFEGVGFASFPNYMKFIKDLLKNPKWKVVDGFEPVWEGMLELEKMRQSTLTQNEELPVDCDLELA